MLKYSLALAVLAPFWSLPAAARPLHADAPPSGIVVHLFGPGSVSEHFLPAGPDNGTKADQNDAKGSAAPGAAGVASPGADQPAGGMTVGDALHEMFVTGDPDKQPGTSFAKGRGQTQPAKP